MSNDAMTKHGIYVKPGQVWRDLDKRMDRYCKVVQIDNGKAVMQQCRADGNVITERTTRVSIRRMYRHATGWDLVKP